MYLCTKYIKATIMTKFLGSQFGILIFIIIGMLVVWGITKVTGNDKLEKDDFTGKFIFVAALIIALICYFLS